MVTSENLTKRNQVLIVIGLFLLILGISYISNFQIYLKDSVKSILIICIFIAALLDAKLISIIIIENIPEHYFSKKWIGVIQIIPIIFILGILFVHISLFDLYRKHHYEKYGVFTTGQMTDSKHYTFTANGEKQYGKVKIENFNKNKGENVEIHYSEKNPIINELIK